MTDDPTKQRAEPGTCFLWRGPVNKAGYGLSGRRLIHRIEWDIANGPIPDGMVVHHRCEERACYNIDHLELMSRADHVAHHNQSRRGKQNCTQHPPEDFYTNKTGHGICMGCRRESDAKRELHPDRAEYHRQWQRDHYEVKK